MMMKKRTVVAGFAGCVVVAGAVLAGFLGKGRGSGQPGQQTGTIRDARISESSGIVASRRWPGVFWTHNDQGSEPVLYAISREGRLIGEFKVDAENHDWEDIAIDGEGRLYIGDIGDNGREGKHIEVLCISEPDMPRPGASGKPLAVVKRWRLGFPDKPFDCESLFIHGGSGYVISKLPKGRAAGLYQFPLDDGRKSPVLKKVATLPIDSPVTGADIAADGSRLAVVSMKSLDVFDIAGDPARAGSSQSWRRIALHAPHDIEACCFVPGGVLTSAESREIYYFPDSLFDACERLTR